MQHCSRFRLRHCRYPYGPISHRTPDVHGVTEVPGSCLLGELLRILPLALLIVSVVVQGLALPVLIVLHALQSLYANTLTLDNARIASPLYQQSHHAPTTYFKPRLFVILVVHIFPPPWLHVQTIPGQPRRRSLLRTRDPNDR